MKTIQIQFVVSASKTFKIKKNGSIARPALLIYAVIVLKNIKKHIAIKVKFNFI